LTITPEELLRRFVLNEASDSYQPFGRIEQESRNLAAKVGLDVNSAAVVGALAGLIKSGLVKAVWLSSREPAREIEGVPDESDIPRVYFFQTEEGLRANADDFWPLDNQENLLPDISIINAD
jgi:hypothetical protein